MKVTSPRIFFIVVFFIAIIISVISVRLYENNSRNLLKIKELTWKNDSLMNFHSTIDMMSKTLQVAYALAPLETRYYSYIFYDFSKQYNLPWTIYPSCIKIESNWNGTLVSQAKARGLMQLISGTARIQAGKFGMKYVEGVTEWNDINNLIMGCDYLSDGFKDTDNGFKKYIGGSGWVKSKKFEDMIKEYSENAKQENVKLNLIYKGLLYEKEMGGK